MKIEVRVSEEMVILHCAGRIVQGWETAALRKAVMAQDCGRILLDLSDVIQIDAGGLGLLIELQNWAESAHRTLRFVNPTHSVRDMLATTGLNAVLSVCQDEAAAHHAA